MAIIVNYNNKNDILISATARYLTQVVKYINTFYE